jgi:hypothetical protein
VGIVVVCRTGQRDAGRAVHGGNRRPGKRPFLQHLGNRVFVTGGDSHQAQPSGPLLMFAAVVDDTDRISHRQRTAGLGSGNFADTVAQHTNGSDTIVGQRGCGG